MTLESKDVEYSYAQFQTNYAPDHFKRGSTSMKRWQKIGWKSPPRPDNKQPVVGGHSGFVLSIGRRGLDGHIKWQVDSGGYPRLTKFVERYC